MTIFIIILSVGLLVVLVPTYIRKRAMGCGEWNLAVRCIRCDAGELTSMREVAHHFSSKFYMWEGKQLRYPCPVCGGLQFEPAIGRKRWLGSRWDWQAIPDHEEEELDDGS